MSVIKNLIAWEELLFFFVLYRFRIPKPNLIEKLRKKERRLSVSVILIKLRIAYVLCDSVVLSLLVSCVFASCWRPLPPKQRFYFSSSSLFLFGFVSWLILPGHLITTTSTPVRFPPNPPPPNSPHILNLLPFINSTPDHFPFVDIDFLSYAETSSLHSTHWSGTMQFNSQFRSTKNADFGWKLKPFLLLKKCWPISQSFTITILIFALYYFHVCKINS